MIHNRKLGRRKAFTLIELIVVLVILGILAALAIPTFNAIRSRGSETVAYADATTIARAASTLFIAYDGKEGDNDKMVCGAGGTEVCDKEDAVANAARESGFNVTSTPYTKGETEIDAFGAGGDKWEVTSQADSAENAQKACILYQDQAFVSEEGACTA